MAYNTINTEPLIVDWNGKPLSSKEINGDPETPERRVRYSLPIGGGYRYYKVKIKDKQWGIGCVKDRPIPKGATFISPKTAFEMIYGVEEANRGQNKKEWKKVTNYKEGSVIVDEVYRNEETSFDTNNLPNANSEEFESITKEFEKHNI